MRARDVEGKKIVAVRQRRVHKSDTGDYVGYAVEEIELEDGTLLRPLTLETGYDYATELIVVRHKRNGERER